MKKLRLEDLVPQDAKFRLSHEAFKDTEFIIKKFTLSDEIWLRQTFGGATGVQSIFSEIKEDELSRMVFHQLPLEQKKLFAVQDVEIVNEAGEVLKMQLGGYKLFQSVISGKSELLEILRSLMEAVGLSRPVQDEMSLADEKKNTMSQTGPSQSSIAVTPTDGQSSIVSREL